MEIVNHGQSIFDVATQHAADISEVFNIALKNGYSITGDLTIGSKVEIPNVVDMSMVKFFSDQSVVPATGLLLIKDDEEIDYNGIGDWAVGLDFIIT